eukprot:4476564-Pyramimonas_sp.AAC.1
MEPLMVTRVIEHNHLIENTCRNMIGAQGGDLRFRGLYERVPNGSDPHITVSSVEAMQGQEADF